MSPRPSKPTARQNLVAAVVVLAFIAVLCSGIGAIVWVASWSKTSFALVTATLVAVAVWRANRTRRRNLRFANGGDADTARRVRRGEGLPLDELARRLGSTAAELRSHRPDYREVRIPKRRGGERRLLVPGDATKTLQRRILRRVLVGLRAHAAATGFERGKSVVDNALPHVGRAVVLKMDFVDFFPATKTERVLRYFQWIGWSREAAEVLANLTTHQGGLPQGAPTSPRLSNLVNHYLDVQIAGIAAKRGGVYTRYADDITISYATDEGARVRETVQAAMAVATHYGYRLHTRRKLHVARRHQRQIVTGLVVNERVRLPREIRRRLRATCHRLEKGLPPLQGVEQAAGWLAYARMVETQAASKAAAPPRTSGE